MRNANTKRFSRSSAARQFALIFSYKAVGFFLQSVHIQDTFRENGTCVSINDIGC